MRPRSIGAPAPLDEGPAHSSSVTARPRDRRPGAATPARPRRGEIAGATSASTSVPPAREVM